MNTIRHHYINTSIICFMLLQSCDQTTGGADDINIPRVFVLAADPALHHSDGIWWLGSAPFSGWVYSLYDTGDTASVISLYKGREHGMVRAWYPNRQLKEARRWSNGRKTGEHKG